MVEAVESERCALDAFDEVVDRFGRSVGDVSLVPGNDLVAPFADGAAEATDFEGHGVVGEVAGDLGDPLGGEVRVGVVVDLADDLLSAFHASQTSRVGSPAASRPTRRS